MLVVSQDGVSMADADIIFCTRDFTTICVGFNGNSNIHTMAHYETEEECRQDFNEAIKLAEQGKMIRFTPKEA